jgi:hypothetical protein
MGDGKDGGRGAKRAAEHTDDRQREDRTRAKNANRMADVAGQILERPDTAGVADLLFHLRDAAHRKDGLTPRLFWIGTSRDPLCHIMFEMKRQLLVELAIGSIATEERAPALVQIGE